MSCGGGRGDGSEPFEANRGRANAESLMSSSPDEAQQLPRQRYKFTPEEIRVLKECNRESFYYRCLPLGTALGVGAYYAIRMGYLKPSARFGAGPKMFMGSIVGYFLGKFSYQSKCAEKLMQLPNSQLAEMLRKQKGKLGFQEALGMEPGFVTAAPAGGPAFPSSEYGPSEPGSFTDVGDTRPMGSYDTESSTFTGIDYNKYDTTQQMLNDDNLPQRRPPFSTTYDDLRKQNRDEFDHKVHGHSSASTSSGTTYEGSKQTRQPASRETTATQKKNIYGDVWDDKPQ